MFWQLPSAVTAMRWLLIIRNPSEDTVYGASQSKTGVGLTLFGEVDIVVFHRSFEQLPADALSSVSRMHQNHVFALLSLMARLLTEAQDAFRIARPRSVHVILQKRSIELDGDSRHASTE